MNEASKEFLDSVIQEREANRDKPVDREEIERQHQLINAPGYINRTFGKMGSKDNVLAR